MSRVAPEQLTFDFGSEVFDDAHRELRESAEVIPFSLERLHLRKLQAEKERDRRLLEDAAHRVRFF